MGIPLNLDFEMGVAKPIDSRFVMTKAQMLSVDDNVMPQVYGCWCSEDGKPYIYNKNNVADAETGKFVVAPDGYDIDVVKSAVVAQQGNVEAINALQARLDIIENVLKGGGDETFVLTEQSFAEGVWKKDFLPQHEVSKFCQKVEVTYVGEYSTASADSLELNGQTFNLNNTHGTSEAETTVIKIARGVSGLDVICNDVVIGSLADTIILTVQITSENATALAITKAVEVYSYVDYRDVDVKSKNGKAISETYEGEIMYWTTNFAVGNNANSFSAKHSKAVYSIGNFTGAANNMFMVRYNTTTYTFDEENIVRYCYMANWDLSGVTTSQYMFHVGTASDTTNEKLYNCDPKLWEKALQHLDFSKVVVPTAVSGYYFLVSRPNGTSVGSFANFGATLKRSTNVSLSFARLNMVKTLGDLSSWDITNVVGLSELFSRDHELQFVGDIGSWNIGSQINNIKNMFRECFNIRGISSAISDWDLSNCVGLNNTFDTTFYIGDNTLHLLWKWDTSKVANMKFCFTYACPNSFRFSKSMVGERLDGEMNVVLSNNNAIGSGELTDAERRLKEEQNIGIIANKIIDRKTDLSFVEKWNVSACGRFTDMFSFNPYLVNIGDLRSWQIDAENTYLPTDGFEGFIQYCIALETFKMPSIPAGANVTNIARGCVSLANIEVNALSNDISIEDCPLTKQSVINLIDAATVSLTITLEPTVYETMIADADVQSAISEKAGSSIVVNLGTI